MREAARHNDCLSINYNQSRFLRGYDGPNILHHNATGDKGTERYALSGVGERVMREDIPRTDWDWMIYPEGMYDLLVRIHLQYPNYREILITENGMGAKDELVDGIVDDSYRIDYVRTHLEWLLRARDAGVNVTGYFLWSLMDMFSWTNGYNKRYGFFYVDFETQQRIPKASAYWFAQVARMGALA
jgi:6-phospho-beta-galactosidase